MESPTIKVIAKEGAKLPEYKTKGAAGADICAFFGGGIYNLLPGERAVIPTGLVFEIPEGYEVQIRPRSGLAAKNGVTVLNAPGTIDFDYRGEVGVILINHGADSFLIRCGDRIAQMVIAPISRADFVVTENLTETERGDGGYGSTGK